MGLQDGVASKETEHLLAGSLHFKVKKNRALSGFDFMYFLNQVIKNIPNCKPMGYQGE